MTAFPTATVLGYPRIGRHRELKRERIAFVRFNRQILGDGGRVSGRIHHRCAKAPFARNSQLVNPGWPGSSMSSACHNSKNQRPLEKLDCAISSPYPAESQISNLKFQIHRTDLATRFSTRAHVSP